MPIKILPAINNELIFRGHMFKQIGISSIELLLSLTIVSSISAYTLTLSEEVESEVKNYQQTVDVKKFKAKIQSRSSAD
jgi:hypothetical protein